MNRRVRTIGIIAVLLIAGIGAFAQTGSFGGKRRSAVQVQIRSNVRGAEVYLGKMRGRTPFTFKIAPGYYTIRVSAKGYTTFNGRINVSKNRYQTINITLQPLTVYVNISANIKGARIYLNNRPRGETPAGIRLTPGTYNLRLEADGYTTYQAQLRVTTSSRQNYNFRLQPSFATLNLVIPPNYLNKPGKSKKYLVRVWVDDKPLNSKGAVYNLQVPPGNHKVRIDAGAVSVTNQFAFKPGVVYNLELFMEIRLKR